MAKNAFPVDQERIQEHLDFLDKGAKEFAFASFTEKGREDKSSVSARMTGSLSDHIADMQRYQDNYAALYVSVNDMEGGYTKDHIRRVRALFLDLDNPSATLDDIHACPLPVHRIAESSPGKHQCYWLVDDLTKEEAEGFTRWLVRRYSADKGVWDTARVLRLPGTWHLKSDPFMCRVVYTAKKVKPYTITEIDRAGVQWVPEKARLNTTDYIPPSNIDAEKLVTLVNGGDEACLDIWEAAVDRFHTHGMDGSAYHMSIASMIKKCRLPIEVFDVYVRAWVAKHPHGDRQNKIQRPGYISMTWAKNTMGVALRPGETWEGWRKRRETVMALFDEDEVADDGEPDIDGLEQFMTGCSDDALALRAADAFRGNMRFTPQFGKWHLWDGVKWTEDKTSRAKDAVRAFLRAEAGVADDYSRELSDAAKGQEKPHADELKKLGGKMKTLANRLRKTKTLTDVISMLILEHREGAEVVISSDEWDKHDHLLATAGGVVDLTTGKMMADGRRFYCSKVTMTEPAPEGTIPKKWLKFLNQIFDDLETIEFMHRFFGYALTGLTREECFVFGYGNGRNGKGVMVNTVAKVMGNYAKTIDADMFTLAGASQHKSALAALQGVRFAISSEIPDGAAWNLQRIKNLTGSDTIEANLMRRDKFEFEPKLTLMICANDKPTIKNVDNAIRARFRFVQFPHSFLGRENLHLKDDLREEHPAILRWLIDGAVKYLKSGLTYPEGIKKATDDYLDEADVLKNWFEEVQWPSDVEEPRVEEGWFTSGDLLNHYANYCRSLTSKTVGKYAFLSYLRGKGLEQERKTFKYRYTGQVKVWGPFRDIITKR